MSDVLSQSQIDALLESMKESEPEETKQHAETKQEEETQYSKYDFYSPRKFTKDKVKILNSIFENYARILTSQVNGIFRVMTDITVMEVRECRYYEFVNSLHENDSLALVDAEFSEKGKNNVPLMLYVTPGLIITLINHMLGGGDEVVKLEENYRYSDVEMALYRRVVGYFVQALKDGFANYISAAFSIQRIEENPSMFQEVGLDETVALIFLNVDVAGMAVEKIRICMPGTLLEYMFHLIDSRKHIARGYSYEDNKNVILEHLRYSKLPVTGQLGTVKLDLEDLYGLQVGDIIEMNKPKDGNVVLFVGRQPWFTGKLGAYKKNIAIRIEKQIYETVDEEEDNEASHQTNTN